MSQVCFCIYCGKAISPDDGGIEEAHRRMTEHDRLCPKNPLVLEFGQLKRAHDRLVKEHCELLKLCRELCDNLGKLLKKD